MINFKTIRYKNFLSSGNSFIEIDLNSTPTTLIVGSNGSGKSTMIDAICFCLFGKPYRKANKPQLINSINGKQTVVEVEFQIGKYEYMVRRGIKPNKFEIYINDELWDQDAAAKDYQDYLENQILRINYKSFTQVVVLGSRSYVPFMRLTTAQRREIVEDLLDIRVFSFMNANIKGRLSVVKSQFDDVSKEIDHLMEMAKVYKNNLEAKKADDSIRIGKLNEDLNGEKDNLKEALDNLNNLQGKVEDLDESVKIELKNNIDEIRSDISDLNSQINVAQKTLKFLEDNDTCPTCEQEIDLNFKVSKINDMKEEIQASQSIIDEKKKEMAPYAIDIVRYEEKENEQKELEYKIRNEQSHIKTIKHSITRIEKDIEDIRNSKNMVQDDTIKEKLKEISAQGKVLVSQKKELEKSLTVLQYAARMLKDDGIKATIIKKYMPVMNQLVNNYLTALGFFVGFEFDENFDERILSRHRDEFSYENFSEGEKLRIDLSLMFTWRQIAKLKNSMNTNLLIMDEVFDASLDSDGSIEFLRLLKEMGNNTNIFVISHHGNNLADSFDRTIKFSKIKNFSDMEI